MEEEIVKTYYEYYDKILSSNYHPTGYLQVVIKMKPKAFFELIDSGRTFRDEECCYMELAGFKTPILLEEDLPENVEFVMESRKEYERKEQEELLQKWFRMFGNI